MWVLGRAILIKYIHIITLHGDTITKYSYCYIILIITDKKHIINVH